MAKNNVDTERHYDSEVEEGCMPLPPGMDAQWFAREGINVLLNGGVNHAEQLFQKYRHCSPLLSAGASLVDFITAAMTFEDEKMDHALNSLKGTIKMCQVDSLFEGILHKRPSEKWTALERIERMIIWADCELFLAFLMFLKQSVVDFVKAGYHMRRAWKMYEKCHREIHGVIIPVNGFSEASKKKKKTSRTSTPPNSMLSADHILILDASLSFGYGLIQVAFSIVPVTLLKVCELFGFHANREVGLNALKLSSSSGDMKAPIARLTLLWYHTVVRPFCALDGNNIELGLHEASLILNESEKDFPTSAIFLYFKALVCRLRGNLDTALEILNKTLDSAKEQREIGLLCYYDKGWCHIMQLEWDKAVPCFTQLKSQSRWSEAYYTYLLAVTLGSIGESEKAYVFLKSVPKLVVRKTQLEIFLARKSHTFKRGAPTREEFVLLSIELLYLWNTLSQCSTEGLKKMLDELEKCESVSFQPLKLLIMGSVCAVLNDTEAAVKNLNLAACKSDTKLVDAHVVPYALYELAAIEMQHEQNYDKAREILCNIKENYSGYDFENRLNFRIHAALNNLDDRAQEMIGRSKLSPPQVDGL